MDKSIHFVSARDEAVYEEFPELSRQSCLEEIHMLTVERQILRGTEVVDYLVKTLPGISKLAWLLDNEQGKKVKDFFYQKVEELREITLKKREECDQCPRR